MDELFFYSSKIVWMLMAPDNLFVILLVTSLLLLLFRQTRKGLALLTLLTLSLLLLSVFPIGSWLLYPLESRFQSNPSLPDQVDGIIVLGGSVLPQGSQDWNQLQTNFAHERLSSFIQLAKRYPDARLLFTGGNASLNRKRPSEANWVKPYLIQSGITEDRLILENKARNTAENVTLSKKLLDPQPGQQWILITTAFHMPRSVGIFCQQGWPVMAYPVDYQTVPSEMYRMHFNLLEHARNLALAAREWAGLLAYYLTAKTGQLLPTDCRP